MQNGQAVKHKSLGTREWDEAEEKLRRITGKTLVRQKGVAGAVTAYLATRKNLADSTLRKYKNSLRHLYEYGNGRGIKRVSGFTLDDLDGYWSSRGLAQTAEEKERVLIVQFFRFCKKRGWCHSDPTDDWEVSKSGKAIHDPAPYTREEMAEILAACDSMGRASYERLRARAMVLLMRHTGLRISDVAMLRRDRIINGKIVLRTLKTHGQIKIPLPALVLEALAVLPTPRKAPTKCRYYFWNGISKPRTAVGLAEQTMTAVFKLADVEAGIRPNHRFRHTLATSILATGGTMQDVADVLGISAKIAEQHYAKWSVERQIRISAVMQRVQGAEFVSATEAVQ